METDTNGPCAPFSKCNFYKVFISRFFVFNLNIPKCSLLTGGNRESNPKHILVVFLVLFFSFNNHEF